MTYMDPSFFSMHTEKLIEVLYERNHCPSYRTDVTMLCSRVVANNRFLENSSVPLIEINDIQNEYTSDDEIDLFSDKRKLTTTIEDETCNIQQLPVFGSKTINEVLKNIGLVCLVDRMYTMQPSQLYYHKHNITSYSPRQFFSPKLNSSMNRSEKYKLEGRSYSSPSLKYSGRKSFTNVDCNRNHSQNRSLISQNYSYEEKRNYSCFYGQKQIPIKYWSIRHMLFSKFDLGILLDDESFYSVCPEILSLHIAKRCKSNIAMDPFCGAGGNIIQLALTCNLVIAIDIDPNKIKCAKHNAEIYGVADKIEFIIGDFFKVSSMLKADIIDVIFMSPPWGGPEYVVNNSFSLESMCKDLCVYGGFGIFNIVKKITSNIAFHMPKTTNIYGCLWLAKDDGKVEIQQNIINNKLNSITAFYGNFTEINDNDY